MVSTACIYNPSWGNEEQIDEQLVFTYGCEEISHFVRAIGIAQGVAEFAYSFDKHPVTYLETKSSLILVQRLEAPSNADWREGFWLTCTIPSPKCSPESMRSVVRDAYRQWRFHHGSLDSMTKSEEGKAIIRTWWTAFCTHWPQWHDLGAAAALPYIRLEPGRVNPIALQEADRIREEMGAKDLMVVTTSDAAAIWPGSISPLSLRVDTQYWLFECALTGQDASYSESLGFVRHLKGEFENRKSESWVPDLGWYENLPTVSFNSSWMPSLTFHSDKQTEKPPTATFLGNPEKPFYDEMMNVNYILLYRKDDHIFVLFYDEPFKINKHVGRQCDRLESILGGANFAPSPVPRFSYIFIDHSDCTITSTFDPPLSEEDCALHEILVPVLISSPKEEVNRVMRRGRQWLYWKRISPETSVVFGKKRMEKDAPTLLGALHRETAEWLENHVRLSADQESLWPDRNFPKEN